MTAKQNIFVFGEIHTNSSNVKHIADRIKEIKPEYLLHELLYDDLCYTKATIEHRLRECKEGGICDPSLNKDIYELGKNLDIKLVGIDLDDPELSKLSIEEQFKKREQRMVRVIRKHMELIDNPIIVIVVGDTHLREKESKELGKPSPLMELFKNDPRVKVERAPKSIQEMP